MVTEIERIHLRDIKKVESAGLGDQFGARRHRKLEGG